MAAADTLLALLPPYTGDARDGLTVADLAAATGYAPRYCAKLLAQLKQARRAQSRRLPVWGGTSARWFVAPPAPARRQWTAPMEINGRRQVRRKH